MCIRDSCRIGLGPLGDLLEKILDGEASMEDLELLRQTAESIFLSADCAIGYGAAELVINSCLLYTSLWQAPKFLVNSRLGLFSAAALCSIWTYFTTRGYPYPEVTGTFCRVP